MTHKEKKKRLKKKGMVTYRREKTGMGTERETEVSGEVGTEIPGRTGVGSRMKMRIAVEKYGKSYMDISKGWE
jgi:hypothetical protein